MPNQEPASAWIFGSGESRYPEALSPVLENFHPSLSPDHTDCPWVSEDGSLDVVHLVFHVSIKWEAALLVHHLVVRQRLIEFQPLVDFSSMSFNFSVCAWFWPTSSPGRLSLALEVGRPDPIFKHHNKKKRKGKKRKKKRQSITFLPLINPFNLKDEHYNNISRHKRFGAVSFLLWNRPSIFRHFEFVSIWLPCLGA